MEEEEGGGRGREKEGVGRRRRSRVTHRINQAVQQGPTFSSAFPSMFIARMFTLLLSLSCSACQQAKIQQGNIDTTNIGQFQVSFS